VHDIWLPSSQRATGSGGGKDNVNDIQSMSDVSGKKKDKEGGHKDKDKDNNESVTMIASQPSSWMRGWWMAVTGIFGILVLLGIATRLLNAFEYKSHSASWLDVDPFDVLLTHDSPT
jgi:hypothetical protein